MDTREDPDNTPNDDGRPDERERLRASIARQAAAIRRAASARFDQRAPRWSDHETSDAAFKAAAEAWEREATLPRRGWETDLPDPPLDFEEVEREPAVANHRRAARASDAKLVSGLSRLRDLLLKVVSRRKESSAKAREKAKTLRAASAARLDEVQVLARAGSAESDSDRREGGKRGEPDGSDSIGDFAERILDELLDGHGGPRNERARRR